MSARDARLHSREHALTAFVGLSDNLHRFVCLFVSANSAFSCTCIMRCARLGAFAICICASCDGGTQEGRANPSRSAYAKKCLFFYVYLVKPSAHKNQTLPADASR